MDSRALAIILMLVLVVVLFSFLRGRGGERRRPELIQLLLFDVRINQVLVETFHLREKPKRFERNNWEINKNRIGFLGEPLRETLKMTFRMVEDINADIKRAKKAKTGHQDIDVTKLAEPLAECRKGLEDWMMDNVGTTQLPPRHPSLMDMIFGGQ